MADPDTNLIRKKVLLEADAKRLFVQYDKKTGTRTLVRHWPRIPDQLAHKVLAFMDTYGSAANTTASQYVTDPTAGTKEKFPGKWTVIRNRMSQGDEPQGVPVQELTKVYDASTLAKLAAMQYVKTRDNQILDLFDFETGEADACAFVWRNIDPLSTTETFLMDTLTDSQLVTQFASGWTYADRHWKLEDNGTATFSVAFRKISWNTWASVRGTPDIIEETRVGLNYAQRTKTWFGVRKADERTAMDDIQSDTGNVPADSGYHVVSGNIQNAGDGRIVVTQTQVAQTTEAGTNLSQEELINAFALVSGTMNRLTKLYEDYSTSELAALSPSTPADYTLVDTKTDPSSRSGLYIRRYIYEKVTWSAWSGNTYSTYNLIAYRNQGRNGEQRTKAWFGIQKADLTTALDYLKDDDHCDTDFHVLEARATDNGNGSVTLSQVSVKKTVERAKEDGNLTGQQIIDPHDFVSGTLDTKRSVYETHDETELAAVSDNTPSGYTFVRKTPGMDGNGLYSLTFDYEKATWTAWSNASPDLEIREKSGKIGESRRKYWFGIRIADASTALSATRTDTGGVPADSGFHVVDATFQSRGNGAGTVVQTQIKLITETSSTGRIGTTQKINPHHLVEGTLYRIRAIYDRYSTTELSGISEATPAGYTLVDQPTDINLGAGLYRREYLYEKTSWRSWSNSRDPDITDYRAEGTIHESRTRVWLGIKQAHQATAEAALKNGGGIGAPTGYTVDNVDIQDSGNGSIACTQTIVRMFSWGHDTGAYDDIEYDNPNTDRESRTKTWYNIDEDDQAAAVTALKDGTGNFAPDSGYVITSVRIRDNQNGTVTLTQRQAKQLTAIDVERIEKLNHKGLFEGLATTTRIVWENYMEGSLPAGTNPAVGNDYLSNEKIGPDSGGFFSRINIARTYTWNKTRSDAKVFSVQDISDEYDGTGTGQIRTKYVEGVPIANLITEFNAISAASGYVLASKLMRELGNGMGALQWVEGTKPTSSSIVWYKGGTLYYTHVFSGTGANRVLTSTALKRRKRKYTMTFHTDRDDALTVFKTGQPEQGSVGKLGPGVWYRILIQEMAGVSYTYTT